MMEENKEVLPDRTYDILSTIINFIKIIDKNNSGKEKTYEIEQ